MRTLHWLIITLKHTPHEPFTASAKNKRGLRTSSMEKMVTWYGKFALVLKIIYRFTLSFRILLVTSSRYLFKNLNHNFCYNIVKSWEEKNFENLQQTHDVIIVLTYCGKLCNGKRLSKVIRLQKNWTNLCIIYRYSRLSIIFALQPCQFTKLSFGLCRRRRRRARVACGDDLQQQLVMYPTRDKRRPLTNGAGRQAERQPVWPQTMNVWPFNHSIAN